MAKTVLAPKVHEGDHWHKYRNDAMHNGGCVTSSQLTDANDGDGGLAFIPGIHKSNFVGNMPADVRSYERQRRNLLPPSIGKRPRIGEVTAWWH